MGVAFDTIRWYNIVMDSTDFDFVDCPNCGGADFDEIAPNRYACAYCGTTVTSRAPENPPADLVRCPHCGTENTRGARFCNRCGKTLTGWWSDLFNQRDPAVISIAVSLVGTFLIPLPPIGAIAGLALGYRALNNARAGEGNSEKLAKWAVAIGWGTVAYSALPLCLFIGGTGSQATSSICKGLFDFLDRLIGP